MKEKIEKLINETLERYEFELPKDEYSVIANELAQDIVKLLPIPDVIKSVCPINGSIIIEKCIYRGEKCSVCIK